MKNVLTKLCTVDPNRRPDAATIQKDKDYIYLVTKNQRAKKAIDQEQDQGMKSIMMFR